MSPAGNTLAAEMLPCLGVIPPPAQGAAPRGTLCVFVALTPAAPPGDRQEAGPRVCPLTGPVPPQAWADAFRSSPDLTGVVHTYEELKRKGVEFPTADLDALSPIHTPQRVSLRRLPIRRLQSPSDAPLASCSLAPALLRSGRFSSRTRGPGSEMAAGSRLSGSQAPSFHPDYGRMSCRGSGFWVEPSWGGS